MKVLLAIIALVFLSFIVKKREIHSVVGQKVNSVYETFNDQMDGEYKSFYKNGVKKSEGHFKNNYRTGKWTIWDSLGKVLTIRKYESPFSCTVIFPKTKKTKTIRLLNVQQYDIQYNKEGYIQYYPVKERMIIWAKRLLSEIHPKNNETIFENNTFLNHLIEGIKSNDIKMYSSYQFKKIIELNQVNLDTATFKVHSYKIKEDSFFDNERLILESRIISICPVVINKNTNDTTELFWVYFPHIRKIISKIDVSEKNKPNYIKTLDDLFFYRFYSSTILEESDIFSLKEENKKTNPELIQIEILEEEHDIWCTFVK